MTKTYTLEETIRWEASLPARPSSAALLLEAPDGRTLAVKASYKEYWTTPSGVIEANETPKQAAIRETFEEVGIEIDEARISFLGVNARWRDDFHSYHFIFQAKISDQEISQVKLQAGEIDSFEMLSKEEILNSTDKKFNIVLSGWANDNIAPYSEFDLVTNKFR